MKPILFIDIDGVIHGHYGGHWQVRPYVMTLLAWARNHFDIKWLSWNSDRANISRIVSMRDETTLAEFPENRNYKYGKLDAILYETKDGQDWIMIEDERPSDSELKYLQENNLADRWIVVPECGADVLLDVKVALEHWVKDKKVIVPFEWTRVNKDIDPQMSTVKVWQGYKITEGQ